MDDLDSKPSEAADAEWFREPTRREHTIGAALFIGFSLFFILFYYVERDSNFRWIVLGLAVISLARGLRHAFRVLRPRP